MDTTTSNIKSKFPLRVLIAFATIFAVSALLILMPSEPSPNEVDFRRIEELFRNGRKTNREMVANYGVRQSGWTIYRLEIEGEKIARRDANFGIAVAEGLVETPVILLGSRYMLVKTMSGKPFSPGIRRCWVSEGWELLDFRR